MPCSHCSASTAIFVRSAKVLFKADGVRAHDSVKELINRRPLNGLRPYGGAKQDLPILSRAPARHYPAQKGNSVTHHVGGLNQRFRPDDLRNGRRRCRSFRYRRPIPAPGKSRLAKGSQPP